MFFFRPRVVAGLPILGGQVGRPLVVAKHHRLHGLAHHAVRQHHHRSAVPVRQIEGEGGEIHRLLRRSRSQHDRVIHPVAAALGGLEIVPLGRSHVAQAGSTAHHVHDDGRQFAAREVGDPFLLEAYSGAGGRGHRAGAGGRGAYHHVDGRDLALGLDEGPAQLRHPPGHILQQLGLRGNRIAEVGIAASPYGALRECLVALHQNSVSHVHLLPVDRYCHLWADQSADRTAGAALLVRQIFGLVELSGVVAQVVDPGGHRDEMTRTDCCAQLAPLASLLIDLDISVYQSPITPYSY